MLIKGTYFFIPIFWSYVLYFNHVYLLIIPFFLLHLFIFLSYLHLAQIFIFLLHLSFIISFEQLSMHSAATWPVRWPSGTRSSCPSSKTTMTWPRPRSTWREFRPAQTTRPASRSVTWLTSKRRRPTGSSWGYRFLWLAMRDLSGRD